MSDNLNDAIPSDEVALFVLEPIRTDLLTIPGVTNDVKNTFIINGIHNTFQLLGLIISLYPPIDDNNNSETISRFLLSESHRILSNVYMIDPEHTNVIIVALLLKIDSMMPGFFDSSTL